MNEYYVVCPVCGKSLKEINKSHLNKHNMTVAEFDLKYQDIDRLSKKSREAKATLKNLTSEISERLKKSHTIEAYIEKHGAKKGAEKFNNMRLKKSKSKTIQGYIENFGEEVGTKKYNEKNNKIKNSQTLEGLIDKHGKSKGTEIYKNRSKKFSKAHKVEGYIERYGYDDGILKWNQKCENISNANSFIDKSKKNDFKLYKKNVMRLTKRNIRKFNFKKIKGFHVDHKFSIAQAFKENISEEIVAHILNIENLPIQENCSKQSKCSVTLEQLILDISNFNEKEYILARGNHVTPLV